MIVRKLIVNPDYIVTKVSLELFIYAIGAYQK
jgi:hypothetical protein